MKPKITMGKNQPRSHPTVGITSELSDSNGTSSLDNIPFDAQSSSAEIQRIVNEFLKVHPQHLELIGIHNRSKRMQDKKLTKEELKYLLEDMYIFLYMFLKSDSTGVKATPKINFIGHGVTGVVEGITRFLLELLRP